MNVVEAAFVSFHSEKRIQKPFVPSRHSQYYVTAKAVHIKSHFNLDLRTDNLIIVTTIPTTTNITMIPARLNYGVGYTDTNGRRRAHVGDMWTQLDVLTALGSEQMMSRTRTIDPERAKAIFISYITCKQRKGKTKADIAYKLEDLERGVSEIDARGSWAELTVIFCSFLI